MTYRNRKYLDYLRTCRCLATGRAGHPDIETVDPAHVGRGGTSSKADDREAIPLMHWLHAAAGQHGEAGTIRDALRPDTLAAVEAAYRRMGAVFQEYADAHSRIQDWDEGDFMLGLSAYAQEEYLKWQLNLPHFVTAGR